MMSKAYVPTWERPKFGPMILERVAKAGGRISKRDLLRQMHHGGVWRGRWDMALDTLVKDGKLRLEGTGRRGDALYVVLATGNGAEGATN